MFSGAPNKSRGHATSYFDEHLSQDDYYTQGQTQQGQWIGVGVERLGIQQGEAVTRDAFLKLCENQHPETGAQLTPQHFKDRRIFFDFVCSAPKSVSILAVTMEDPRVLEAHKEASEIAIRELEQFAGTRVRKGGIEEGDRMTKNLVGASFLHTTSRALDPQLHTHFVLFNTTWDPKENRWKAFQTGGMFGALNYGTAVYRNELAKRLHGIGYQIRQTSSAFEIEGVDPKLLERFSKRSQQRDIAVHKAEERLGRKLTKKEISHVVHQSRPKKIQGASEAKVRDQQLGELGFFERRRLRNVVEAAAGQPQEVPLRVTTETAIQYAIEHVFERQSVAPQHKIWEAALNHGCGQLDLQQLKSRLASRRSLVSVGAEYSTRDILTKELFLIRSVNAGRDLLPPLVERYLLSKRLGPDQRHALTHVLSSRDQFTGFRGLAGTGKSTTLVELARVLRSQRWEPFFCAPTASATDTLREELRFQRLEPVTIAKLLADPAAQRQLSSHSVLVVDEAAAVGLDDMRKLFELTLSRGIRMILSGDTGQHASVARGDALRIIEEYSRYQFAELKTIRRQTSQAFRQAVELAANQKTTEAFLKLEQLGAVIEAPNDHGELHQKAAGAYLEATRGSKQVILVCPTWSEIDAVTAKVRDSLKADGLVGQQDQTVEIFRSLSWTEAQKQTLRQFEPGQRLRFVRKHRQFDRGETVEIVSVLENGLRVRNSEGVEVDFIPASSPASFDVGQARELAVAPGDWLLLQANDKARKLTNGERVQVKDIRDGTLLLKDGRAIPENYRTFTHGYALTSQSSQGKTVDEVLVVASSRSFAAVGQEQFYVSISRARDRVRVFTDDAETLRRKVGDSRERKAAVELQGLRDELQKLGFVRSDEIKAPPMSRFRAVRPGRAIRSIRMTPVQRFVQVVEEVARWIGERMLAFGHQQEAAMIQHTQTTSEATRQVETVRPPRTVREAIQQREAARRISIKPHNHGGHSHGGHGV